MSMGGTEIKKEKSDSTIVVPGDRFVRELELVQSLASPEYLHFLAQSRYLDDPAFLAFLGYLTYWKRPEYAIYIKFPQCLAFLDLLLEDPQFRKELATELFRDWIHQQQFLHWRYRLRNQLAEAVECNTEEQQLEDKKLIKTDHDDTCDAMNTSAD
eukprot:369545_1